MGKRKNVSKKKILDFEKKFIEFVDNKIKWGLSQHREWTSIEEQLWKLLNDKTSSVKIEFDKFRGFPNIRIAKLLTKRKVLVFTEMEYLNKELDINSKSFSAALAGLDTSKCSFELFLYKSFEDFKTRNQVEVIFLEKEKRFVPVPATIGKFIDVDYSIEIEPSAFDEMILYEYITHQIINKACSIIKVRKRNCPVN